MSGHWPYIITAYTICFVLFTIDWFVSVFELKKLKRDSIMRQRREARLPELKRASSSKPNTDDAQTANAQTANTQVPKTQSSNENW